jgi:hypothetical protein
MFLAIVWATTLTLMLQFWVGGRTIYGVDVRERVEGAHHAMLINVPPGGDTWAATGSNGVNIRIIPVLLAEMVHRGTGLSIPKSYFLTDSLFLLVGLLLLLGYTRLFTDLSTTLIVVTGIAALLPLTYQLFWFHPWDRVSLVSWILLLWLLFERRLLPFALLLPLAVAVKYDIMLLPGLHMLRSLLESRRIVVRDWLLGSGLLTVGIGTYMVLRVLRPGGFTPTSIETQVAKNLAALLEMNVRWPPFLGFALPASLAVLGFRHTDAYGKASALFGALLMIPFALQSNLAEFRAHIPVLLLLIPAISAGLQRLTHEPASCEMRIVPPAELPSAVR